MQAVPSVAEIDAFDERQFYLEEFRGKTLLLALHASETEGAADLRTLAAVLRTLIDNQTRSIVCIGTEGDGEALRRELERQLLAALVAQGSRGGAELPPLRHPPVAVVGSGGSVAATAAQIWKALRRGPLFVGVVPNTDLASNRRFAERIAARFGVHKLVLLEADGGLCGSDGKAISFLDESALSALLAAGEAEWTGLAARLEAVATIRTALLAGVGSVNLCTLPGCARELFTYEGTGTLFTLQDYCTVEQLRIDDFEEAERLIERGQREGLLKPRTTDEIAELLAHGYGAKIGGEYLAGFCAFVTEAYRGEHAGEIVGLYTITRFKGEGVGARLLDRCVADARRTGMRFVFATTTSERALGFFERSGFRRVTPDEVPAAKWAAYDRDRLARVAVVRLDLQEARGAA